LRDVDRAFRRLPEKQRSAVLLAGIEGKSYAEVATALGMTADAVRCHLARARDRLRTAVYKRDETNWVRPAAARRPRALPAAVPTGAARQHAGELA
jgi:hypothetical protein